MKRVLLVFFFFFVGGGQGPSCPSRAPHRTETMLRCRNTHPHQHEEGKLLPNFFFFLFFAMHYVMIVSLLVEREQDSLWLAWETRRGLVSVSASLVGVPLSPSPCVCVCVCVCVSVFVSGFLAPHGHQHHLSALFQCGEEWLAAGVVGGV